MDRVEKMIERNRVETQIDQRREREAKEAVAKQVTERAAEAARKRQK